MNKYLFYTIDGFTQDASLNETENCQILGVGLGNNIEHAFDNFLNENKYIHQQDYEKIMAYKVIGNPITL